MFPRDLINAVIRSHIELFGMVRSIYLSRIDRESRRIVRRHIDSVGRIRDICETLITGDIDLHGIPIRCMTDLSVLIITFPPISDDLFAEYRMINRDVSRSLSILLCSVGLRTVRYRFQNGKDLERYKALSKDIVDSRVAWSFIYTIKRNVSLGVYDTITCDILL